MKRVAVLASKISPQDLAVVMTALRDVAQSVATVSKVNAARDVALEAIRHKHDLYRQAFDQLFAERRAVIQKHFEVLDRGMATNDQAVILGALEGLGQIVAKSPFTDLKLLANALEGGETIEI
jgi:hypothetical protein